MAIVKYLILTFLALTFALCSKCQTIEKTYTGWWADTWWEFNFHNDSTYKRYSVGHYGSTIVEGRYKLNRDTIQLLSGFKNTSGTVNEFYLLDRDSFLIDLTLLFEYKIAEDRNSISFGSRKRYDILPKPDPNKRFYKSYSELDTLATIVINQLQTKDLRYLSDNDHLNIIRLYNTISSSEDPKFKSPLFKTFQDWINKTSYVDDVRKIYDWTIGIGLGFVISKLQVEIGGSPSWYSIFIPK